MRKLFLLFRYFMKKKKIIIKAYHGENKNMKILYHDEDGCLMVETIICIGYDSNLDGLYIESSDESEYCIYGLLKEICDNLVRKIYENDKLDLRDYVVSFIDD